MNKRQRKRLDNKLRVAIRELNNDVAKYEGFPLITDEQVEETLRRVKESRRGIDNTLSAYEKLLL